MNLVSHGILYTLFATKYYESYISIYPANESDSMNNIMGVGTVLGLDLGQNSTSAFHIPDVISSIRLKRDIVNNKWNSEKFNNKVDLIEYWNLNAESDLQNPDCVTKSSLKRTVQSGAGWTTNTRM